jgi:hypothetical protein
MRVFAAAELAAEAGDFPRYLCAAQPGPSRHRSHRRFMNIAGPAILNTHDTGHPALMPAMAGVGPSTLCESDEHGLLEYLPVSGGSPGLHRGHANCGVCSRRPAGRPKGVCRSPRGCCVRAWGGPTIKAVLPCLGAAAVAVPPIPARLTCHPTRFLPLACTPAGGRSLPHLCTAQPPGNVGGGTGLPPLARSRCVNGWPGLPTGFLVLDRTSRAWLAGCLPAWLTFCLTLRACRGCHPTDACLPCSVGS